MDGAAAAALLAAKAGGGRGVSFFSSGAGGFGARLGEVGRPRGVGSQVSGVRIPFDCFIIPLSDACLDNALVVVPLLV
jgi:hypothetical protein